MPANSPHKHTRLPVAESLHAKVHHAAAAAEVDIAHMPDYVDTVLASLDGLQSMATPSELALPLISNDADVVRAHNALCKQYMKNPLEKESYAPTAYLLNNISVTYYKHCLQKGDAVIFTYRPSKTPLGDYLGLGIQPDVYSYAGTYSDLFIASRSPQYISAQPWSVLLEVGELKRLESSLDAIGQLISYLMALKRCRPDLFTVYGFSLDRGKVRIAALNPGGMSESDLYPMDAIRPWVAHVIQVYESLHRRDPAMRYRLEQERFYRWDVRKAGQGLAVTPFHVGNAPGRTTFACFEVGRLPDADQDVSPATISKLDEEFETGEVKGFWKTSWQRTTTRATEAELLTKLHAKGWVPGLVRHHPATSIRDGDASAFPSGQDNVGRVREILHLGSIGQPLSQCATVEELLDTMYDLLETHAHVCELGVCHRDVSYFNSLCKPRHHLLTHPVLKENRVLERPCIKKIFGNPNGEPCALLTDLDHSTTFEELAKGTSEAARTVGTPMFMSVYLDAPNVPRKFFYQRLLDLLDDLTAAETTRPELFRLAFPRGDGGFIEKFKLVMAGEERRSDKVPAAPVPPARHGPRHDAESIYWVFLYASARALPLGTRQEDLRGTVNYEDFCRHMLSNSTEAVPGRPGREDWMQPNKFDGSLFAPELARLETLFEQMAKYLYIPWHLYCGKDQPMAGIPAHVHTAFRRLILAFKLHPDNAGVLKVALDTSAPRLTTAFDRDALKSAIPTGRREDTGASKIGSRTVETRASSALKRKAEAEAASMTRSDEHASKKARTSPLAPGAAAAEGTEYTDGATVDNDGSAPDVNADPMNAGNDDNVASTSTNDVTNAVPPAADAGGPTEAQVGNPDVQPKEPQPQPEEHYDPAIHQNSLSAKAMRLMFWKDRTLWFGRGK